MKWHEMMGLHGLKWDGWCFCWSAQILSKIVKNFHKSFWVIYFATTINLASHTHTYNLNNPYICPSVRLFAQTPSIYLYYSQVETCSIYSRDGLGNCHKCHNFCRVFLLPLRFFDLEQSLFYCNSKPFCLTDTHWLFSSRLLVVGFFYCDWKFY